MNGIDSRYFLYGFIFIALLVGCLIVGQTWEAGQAPPPTPKAPELTDREGPLDARKNFQRDMMRNFEEVQKKLKEADKR